ncbi:hypothetical protein ERIC1_2c00130 [Paenibacillus larvae subsp. larvae DSM 25719]|uniref:hypothetical protein n=1 Tax=Paenibacillus larvae TaxID=1464 RepID=UPI0003DB9603|nr:hypothetical protein [Paenibacillus larvae]ETK25825.1 hypothetical protein ERIC1_2c00130 [Paenibacillus larvae subsp. larvae DSM 25719]
MSRNTASIQWSRVLIIQKIQDRAAKGLPLNASSVSKDDQKLYDAARRHMGSWGDALKDSGFNPNDHYGARKWSKRRIIEKIQDRVARGLPVNAQAVQQEEGYLYGAAVEYVGSWEKALKEAGIDPVYHKKKRGRRKPIWSKERVIEKIQERESQGLPVSAYSVESKLYQAGRIYFGSWKAALKGAERRQCEAPDCTNSFTAKRPWASYCSRKCFERTRKKRIREERTKDGLCPQCGGPMDYPPSSRGKKKTPSYCSECQQYYHNRYKSR